MIVWAVIFVVGGALCTVLDHQHVVTGVLSYPHPSLWQQAWWVPILFGSASVAAVSGVRTTARFLSGRAYPANVLLADALAFITAYAFTAYANSLPDVVLWVLVAAWVARVLGGAPTWLVIFCLAAAVLGPGFEAGWAHLGFFEYRHPDFFGIPKWLPALYLHSGFLAASFARRFA